jgi:tetratricopeptide (TPR) repeat protein
MTSPRRALRPTTTAAAVLLVVLLCDHGVQAQVTDVLARARAAYASASFEDALALLSSLHDKLSPPESSEAGTYEVSCLVALGRTDEARRAVETILRSDPEYHPSDAVAPPRVRTLFDTVRVQLLPAIARASYTSGRAAFDRKDFAVAAKDLQRAVGLIDELAALKALDDPGLAELRTLASGFRDLSALAAAPPPAPAPSTPPTADTAPAAAPTAAATPPATAPAEAAGVEPKAFGPEDAGVQPPVLVSQPLPTWQPETPAERVTTYHGYLDVVVDERGRVESATLLGSIHKRYDKPLLESAGHWTFRPALKSGVPVRYRFLMLINLAAR